MAEEPPIDMLFQHGWLQVVDQELTGVEAGVWAKIHRDQFYAGTRRLQNSTLALSASLALIAGALFATPNFTAKTTELAAFSSRAHLAPSTLLEGAR
jgi:hypothetical protein